MQSHKVGVGITTHNRIHVAHQVWRQCQINTPNAKVVVVDDASIEPFQGATYRFGTNAGIATAKNKCFELLEDCDYIFLFDDDCYPLKADWCNHYIDASIKTGNQHFSFVFDRNARGKLTGNDKVRSFENNGVLLHEHSNPNGCVLFFTKECIEKAGGMDFEFDKYGFEHMELSRRIFNMGLTDAPFLDVDGSLKLFYSYDYHKRIRSSGGITSIRMEANRQRYVDKSGDNWFKPYKRDNE